MNKWIKGGLMVAAGAAAVVALAHMSTAAVALTLGAVAVGMGGLMASGIADPVEDILKPAVGWVYKTVQKGFYKIRSAVFGGPSKVPAEEEVQAPEIPFVHEAAPEIESPGPTPATRFTDMARDTEQGRSL